MCEWWETFFDQARLRAGFGAVTPPPFFASTGSAERTLSKSTISRIFDVRCLTDNELKSPRFDGDLPFEPDSTWRQ